MTILIILSFAMMFIVIACIIVTIREGRQYPYNGNPTFDLKKVRAMKERTTKTLFVIMPAFCLAFASCSPDGPIDLPQLTANDWNLTAVNYDYSMNEIDYTYTKGDSILTVIMTSDSTGQFYKGITESAKRAGLRAERLREEAAKHSLLDDYRKAKNTLDSTRAADIASIAALRAASVDCKKCYND